jgi:uroporphyrinogen-III synthase
VKFSKRFTVSVDEKSPSPLAGKRVVITRAESQSASLAQALRAKGAEVISLPLIRIAPPEDTTDFDSALRNLEKFDWVVFTSQNAVSATAERLAAIGIRSRADDVRPKIAAVGKSTAESAESFGLSVAYTGKGGTATDLFKELADELRGKRVFLPRSDKAPTALIRELREAGADVTEAVAYRTVYVAELEPNAKEALANGDAVLFLSPSAVHAFLSVVKTGVLSSLQERVAVGAIGPVTVSALYEAGIRCDFQASEPRVDEIVAALAVHFERTKMASASGVQSR